MSRLFAFQYFFRFGERLSCIGPPRLSLVSRHSIPGKKIQGRLNGTKLEKWDRKVNRVSKKSSERIYRD